MRERPELSRATQAPGERPEASPGRRPARSPGRLATRPGERGNVGVGIAIVLLIVVVVGVLLFVLAPGRGTPEQRASERARQEQPSPTPGGPRIDLGGAPALATDWYAVYFTAPKYPDNPADHQGGLDVRLVELMNRATRTLDVADYDFDLENVAKSMAEAKRRGVLVRLVTDTDTLTNTKNREVQAAFDQLRAAGIPIVDDQRPDIMHNKFTVVDGEWVATGSWNYTDGDTYHLNNNLIIVHSPDLAANYTAEFEKMFTQRRFGPSKPKGVPNPSLTIGGVRVQNYFAPEDGVTARIVDEIRTATRSIVFMAFSFTSDPIGQAMLERAKAGVHVTGVFETTGSNTPFSEYRKLREAGIEVYQDGNPWVMHHKVIIVDERTVILGSFNFSENADKSNDENLLIIEDPRLAAAFTTEFDRVLAVAKSPPVRKR